MSSGRDITVPGGSPSNPGFTVQRSDHGISIGVGALTDQSSVFGITSDEGGVGVSSHPVRVEATVYTLHYFTTVGAAELVFTEAGIHCKVLLVGGGGSGGGGICGGGGGAGGFVYLNDIWLAQTTEVYVGAGGVGWDGVSHAHHVAPPYSEYHTNGNYSNNGGNTTLYGEYPSGPGVTAVGGGHGAGGGVVHGSDPASWYQYAASSGGSGGGGVVHRWFPSPEANKAGAAGTTGQGHAGAEGETWPASGGARTGDGGGGGGGANRDGLPYNPYDEHGNTLPYGTQWYRPCGGCGAGSWVIRDGGAHPWMYWYAGGGGGCTPMDHGFIVMSGPEEEIVYKDEVIEAWSESGTWHTDATEIPNSGSGGLALGRFYSPSESPYGYYDGDCPGGDGAAGIVIVRYPGQPRATGGDLIEVRDAVTQNPVAS